MPGDEIYELYIDALTPTTISMASLAEYMADFAELLGHHEHLHFEAVKPGSLSLTSRVEPIARNKVRWTKSVTVTDPTQRSRRTNPWTTGLRRTTP